MSEQEGGNEENVFNSQENPNYQTYRREPRTNSQPSANRNSRYDPSMNYYGRQNHTDNQSRYPRAYQDRDYHDRNYHDRHYHEGQYHDRHHRDRGRHYNSHQNFDRQFDSHQGNTYTLDHHNSYSHDNMSHQYNNNNNEQQGSSRFRNTDNGSTHIHQKNKPKKCQQKTNPNINKTGKAELQKVTPAIITDQGNQATSLRYQIESNTYECMVCYETINAFCATYSCFQCFNIFHLVCIRQWASSKLTDDSLPDDVIADWTCPACQVTSTTLPIRYMCFCNSVINPEYKPFVLPHSCGEKCSRSKKSCDHSCPELCHPGKCPPCLASVVSYCLCGIESKRVKCSLSSSTFRCKNICKKMLNCKKHTCEAICHSGPCEDCPKTNDLVCYCGKSFNSIRCGSEKKSSFLQHCGYWSCSEICSNPLTCENHECSEGCHSGPCPLCATDVTSINSCPCGKTKIEKITIVKRVSCLDAIPTCNKTCKKPLSCGTVAERHICQSLCHIGPCPPCLDRSLLTCACNSSAESIPCIEISKEGLRCEKVCYKKKSCGRHRCNTKCCLEDNHICMIPCGKLLSCKIHKCEELCHRGHCMPCLMSNFDEVYCTCSKTKLEPPVACGTPPPSCHELCSREHNCSHPVTHKCHYDDQCPPCTHLVNKVCMGGHKVRYNVPCHMTDISCGETCGKQLPCDMHNCERWCHKIDCIPVDKVCELPCLEPRTTCPHPCNNRCHSGTPCPQCICLSPIKVLCSCKRREIDLLCFKGSTLTFASADLSRFHAKLKSVGLFVSPHDLLDYLKDGIIQCVERCKIENRNQRFAEGLGLKDVPIDNVSAPSYPESLKNAVKENKEFISEIENTLTGLISKYKKRNASLDPLNKVKFVYHDFKAMNKDKRKIIHDLASFYKIETQSLDDEPQRNVQVKIAYNSIEPTVKLSQFFHKRVIGGIANSSVNSSQKSVNHSTVIPNLQTLDISSLPKEDIVFDNWEDINDD